MREHRLAPTTHTVELAQLAELQAAITRPASPRITAADLGVAGTSPVRGAPVLVASAVLTRLSWDGPPEYPYIHGHFGAGDSAERRIELHTPALQELSHRLHLHHRWGV